MHTGEPVRITRPVCTGTLCDQLPNEQHVIEDLRITSDVISVPTVFHF